MIPLQQSRAPEAGILGKIVSIKANVATAAMTLRPIFGRYANASGKAMQSHEALAIRPLLLRDPNSCHRSRVHAERFSEPLQKGYSPSAIASVRCPRQHL
jgi:hypothetical protein